MWYLRRICPRQNAVVKSQPDKVNNTVCPPAYFYEDREDSEIDFHFKECSIFYKEYVTACDSALVIDHPREVCLKD